MLRVIAAAAGVAAGFVLLSPVVASAAEAPTGNVASVHVAVAGSTVTVTATCVASGVPADASYFARSGDRVLGGGPLTLNGNKRSITFKGVRPGDYRTEVFCDTHDKDFAGVTRFFTVPKPAPSTQSAKPAAKPAPQVGAKPQGAPQTGGGPADDESGATPLLVGGAVALVGAAGAGAVVLRRRAARR
ncbi:hypothetical protein [Amycolatopsis bullii]|uniref:Gram-positive cocci surface proteins LPxTG domain-containing protein n=2 Tax=Amycolatopsis TaxID=1813 RepID=A0ABQ3KLB3_9PSEU|nr:hypothetical protein [Amycolatopsis bullii]GHG29156.1 hypothetical protein GCM10017567_56060 [Amycolatopsis bullii]